VSAITGGLRYYDLLYPPIFNAAGSYIVFPKRGCRPVFKQLYNYSNTGYSNVTFSLTSSADGTVAVNGTKIGKKFTDWNTAEDLPCGPRYLVIALVSGGGGGGAAGLLVNYDNNGGSGGAAIMSVEAEPGRSYSITIGGAGEGKGGISADGTNGGASSAFGLSISGGGGANGGSNNAPRQTATVDIGGTTALTYVLARSNGSDTTASSTLTATYPIPEGGTAASGTRFGGAAGSGSGYGAGGDGNPGRITIWY
jgi:hypothetical protein